MNAHYDDGFGHSSDACAEFLTCITCVLDSFELCLHSVTTKTSDYFSRMLSRYPRSWFSTAILRIATTPGHSWWIRLCSTGAFWVFNLEQFSACDVHRLFNKALTNAQTWGRVDTTTIVLVFSRASSANCSSPMLRLQSHAPWHFAQQHLAASSM